MSDTVNPRERERETERETERERELVQEQPFIITYFPCRQVLRDSISLRKIKYCKYQRAMNIHIW